jgi:hypothetical protein
MSWTEEDDRQVQRLSQIEKHWQETMNPPMPALNAPAPARDGAQTNERKIKPVESDETKSKAPEDFLTKLCDKLAGPGSNRPSGRALGKDSWMG